MAYIIGILTTEERKTLEDRGWDIEKAPAELEDALLDHEASKMCMVWVDSDMFAIMNGPDWDKETKCKQHDICDDPNCPGLRSPDIETKCGEQVCCDNPDCQETK
jgi:hypothetical protein